MTRRFQFAKWIKDWGGHVTGLCGLLLAAWTFHSANRLSDDEKFTQVVVEGYAAERRLAHVRDEAANYARAWAELERRGTDEASRKDAANNGAYFQEFAERAERIDRKLRAKVYRIEDRTDRPSRGELEEARRLFMSVSEQADAIAEGMGAAARELSDAQARLGGAPVHHEAPQPAP